VKINKLYTIFLLLLLAFLNAFSSSAFSFPTDTLDLNSRNFDYLQAEQNKKAVSLEEARITISYEQESSNEFSSFVRIPELQFSENTLSKHSGGTNIWEYSPNARHFLSQQIFPFQFFW